MLTRIRKIWQPVWFSFANSSMKKKMIVVFVFLITLPLMLTSYISYTNFSKSIRENTTTYVQEMNAGMMEKLDQYISDIKRISALPLFMTELQQQLSTPGQTIDKMRNVELGLLSINNIKQDTTSVYIIDNFNQIYYNLKTDGIRQDVNERMQEWRKLAKDADGMPVLLGTQEVVYSSGRKDYVFSVLREIRDVTSITPIGMIVFDTSVAFMDKAVQELDTVTKGKTIILDQSNRVVFDSQKSNMTTEFSDNAVISRMTESEGSFPAVLDGKGYICTYTVSDKTGWKLLAFVPTKEMNAKATLTRNVTLAATLLITGFALFVSIVISHLLTSPLIKMSRLMKQVSTGNLDARIQVRYGDEVGILGRHFNQMLGRMGDLIGEVADSRLHKKEAEMRALQSQINPHFIYNTLETIRMMAELNDDDRVAAMTFNLGQLLRYSLTKGNDIGTVASELEHLENYLSLQNVRFSDRFQLDVDMPPDMYRMPMLKLVFQPIVENAIYHGLEKREGIGCIHISAYKLGKDAFFILTDNGIGMSKDKVEKLNEHFQTLRYDSTPNRSGIGLRNVNERIKLHYGMEYGLTVESKLGEGTNVVLKIRLSSSEYERD